MKKNKHSFLNMYFTTTISISLVLFLVGVIASMFLLSSQLGKYVKENVSFSIILNDSISNDELQRIESILKIAPFSKEFTYISKEVALNEHINSLGEDPAEFLGYNPLLASLEVKINANYANTDSIQIIESKLKTFSSIKRIIYQKDMIDSVNNNLSKILAILAIIAGALLTLSFILINNTIRLNIYSKRFIINTMKLVGATPWVIRAPFIKIHVMIGLLASLLALILLAGMAYYLEQEVGLTLLMANKILVVIVASIVTLTGVCITLLSSYWAVGKYIRMKTNDLYYI